MNPSPDFRRLAWITLVVISVSFLGCRKAEFATVELEPFGDSVTATGRLNYATESCGGWSLTVELDHLAPRQEYWLALNAVYPESQENEILANLPGGGAYDNPVTGAKEGYCDFAKVFSDAEGRLTWPETPQIVPLPPKQSAYAVKLLVKDPFQGGNVFLQAPLLQFIVKPGFARQWLWLMAACGAALVLAIILYFVASRGRQGQRVGGPQIPPIETQRRLQQEEATRTQGESTHRTENAEYTEEDATHTTSTDVPAQEADAGATPNGRSDRLPVETTETQPAGMSWQEAAKRMEQLRGQGEPWPGYRKLAKRFRCSTGTIHKAIRHTPSLQAWAKPQAVAAPSARSLNEVVTDRIAQSREPDPAEDAAIREFVEHADPDSKAWFLAQSRETQLDYLNDPDKFPRVLGRKP